MSIGNQAYTRVNYSFYPTDYALSLGNAMIFRDSSSGQAVGFYDNFNMNASTYRNWAAEGLVTGARMIGGTPFDIYYGTFAKP